MEFEVSKKENIIENYIEGVFIWIR